MQEYVFDPRLLARKRSASRHVRGGLVAAVALITGGLFWPAERSPVAPVKPDAIATWLDTGPRDRPLASSDPADLPAVASRVAAAPVAQEATGPEPASVATPAPEGTGEAVAVTVDDTEARPAADAPEAPAAGEGAAASDTPDLAAADTEKTTPAAQEEPESVVPSRWHEHAVGKGDTLANILRDLGVDREDRVRVLEAAKAHEELAQIKVGQAIRAQLDGDGGLLALQVTLDAKSTLHVELDDDDYQVHTIDRPTEKRVAHATAVIQSSLFADGQEAGLSDGQIMELAGIFGWDVDFNLGLRPGDQLKVIYEAEYLDGKKVDDGAILAAEFVNQGTTYRALRFEDDDGELGYYAPDGTSKKQAFLRSPLKLARVSSGFSLSRMHPILNKRRAHNVDYSAPTGTPVKATGNGLVTFKGQKNGYGNVVELKHGDTYTTLYGHLSRFAKDMRIGEPVKQGEVIGYVGQTGLATGPHLHYEFLVAGKHRDPLSTKLPTAVPLSGQDLAEFRKQAAPLLAKLDRLDRTMVARAE